jgi:hypothetical protein
MPLAETRRKLSCDRHGAGTGSGSSADAKQQCGGEQAEGKKDAEHYESASIGSGRSGRRVQRQLQQWRATLVSTLESRLGTL